MPSPGTLRGGGPGRPGAASNGSAGHAADPSQSSAPGAVFLVGTQLGDMDSCWADFAQTEMESSGTAGRLPCLDDADDDWLSAILAYPNADVEALHVLLDECGQQERLAAEEQEKRRGDSSVACEPSAEAAGTTAACSPAQDAAVVCRAPASIEGRAPGRAGDARPGPGPGPACEPGNEGTSTQAKRAGALDPEVRSPFSNHKRCSLPSFHSAVMPQVLMSATD